MLRARFDRIFTKTTGYAMLDRQLTRLHRLKPDLLRVLDRPENPASHQWIGKRHPHRLRIPTKWAGCTDLKWATAYDAKRAAFTDPKRAI